MSSFSPRLTPPFPWRKMASGEWLSPCGNYRAIDRRLYDSAAKRGWVFMRVNSRDCDIIDELPTLRACRTAVAQMPRSAKPT